MVTSSDVQSLAQLRSSAIDSPASGEPSSDVCTTGRRSAAWSSTSRAHRGISRTVADTDDRLQATRRAPTTSKVWRRGRVFRALRHPVPSRTRPASSPRSRRGPVDDPASKPAHSRPQSETLTIPRRVYSSTCVQRAPQSLASSGASERSMHPVSRALDVMAPTARAGGGAASQARNATSGQLHPLVVIST